MLNDIPQVKLEVQGLKRIKPSQRKKRRMDSGFNRILVDVLIIAFGISSWISINGLWVQTPLLVKSLPEAWDLASYIVVLTQFANIGPIIYTIVKKSIHQSLHQKLETFAIHLILLLGFCACILLSFIWNVTVSNISLPFFILTTISAIVDCTSSVLYFPFVSKFKLGYLRSLLIGEALSGLIPSIVALLQGVGGNPYCISVTIDGKNITKAVYPEPSFSVNSFFAFISVILAISWLSFYLLRHTSIGSVYTLSPASSAVAVGYLNDQINSPNYDPNDSLAANDEAISDPSSHHHQNERMMSRANVKVKLYLFLQGYCCFLGNGICAAIQTYSSLPYGNTTHHLATTLSAASGPIAVILCFFIHGSNENFKKSITIMTTLTSVSAIYIITLAFLSPYPPLLNSSFGPFLIISNWILFHGCNTYARSSIAGELKIIGGHEIMIKYGFATQIGSLIGAIIIFFIMQVFHPFHSYQPC